MCSCDANRRKQVNRRDRDTLIEAAAYFLNSMTDKKKKKIEALPSDDREDETMCTFVLHDEDHTLGNSLRYIILKNPAVEFCGYSVPHPTENRIHLRIQTHPSSSITALEALKKGLTDLSDVCGIMLTTFQREVAHYKSTHPQASGSEDVA